MHGRTVGLRSTVTRILTPTLPAILLILSSLLLGLSAEEKASEGKEPASPKNERLRERNRHAQETAKLLKEGRIREAVEACGKTLAIEREALGDFHEEVAGSLEQLAQMHEALGDFEAAEKDLREALSIRENLHGKKHWRVTDARLAMQRIKRLGESGAQERSELKEAEKLNEQAFDLWRKGRSSEALPLIRRALEIRGRLLGKESPEYARSLNDQGLEYRDTGNFKLAEEAYRQASEIRKNALGEEHPDYAESVHNLAMLHAAMGDYARAEPLCRQALDIRKKALGEEHPDYARSVNSLAGLYQDMGDCASAEPLCRLALEIRKKALGEEHPDYARSLNNLAGLYRDRGDYARAEPLYRQALDIRKKALGEEHPDYARSLNNLALLYKTMGDYARAEPLYRQALETRKRALGEKHPSYAGSLHNLAGLYDEMGDLARAEPLYRQAVEISRKVLGEDHPNYAASLNSLAVLYKNMGDYARAEPLYRQAIEIRKRALGEEHPSYARSLNNLAVLHWQMGNYALAEPLYREAAEIWKKALGEEHPSYAVGLHNLAGLYQDMGDCARAELLYRQALEIRKKTIGEEHPDYAASLSSLATLYMATEDYGRAEPLLRQSLRISRRNLELASSVQSERQQIAMAGSLRRWLDAYLSMGPRAGLAGARLYEEALLWKGAVHMRQSRQRLERSRPELRSLFVELETASSSLATLAFSAPEPKKRSAWKRQIYELTERKERLEGELSSKCAEYAREKALGRISPADLQGILPRDVALVDFLEYTQFTRREASDGSQGSPSDAGTTAGPEARGEAEAKAGAEARAGGEARAGAEERARAEAAAWGASREAQKSPWMRERHLAAFVVLKDSPIVELDLGPLAPIQGAIDEWRGAIASGASSKREVEAAAKLGESLWEPLEKHLAGRRIFLVSPDGALGRFPLGALPGSTRGTYLIEEVSIALLPVPQMLPELMAFKKPLDWPPALLLVGDVDFDAGSPGLDPAAAQGAEGDPSKEDPTLRGDVRETPRGGGLFRFKPLDSTRDEIVKVGDTFEAACRDGKVLRLRGGDATEAALREAAARHEFLHLATHGFFAPQELKSALAQSYAQDSEKLDESLGPGGNVTGWHPGLLSGIVLAGGNGRSSPERDDGILTALELSTLDLGRTELMVLSACETGLGATAGGEGLLGLQRAAQVAGAKTTVASLWNVGDQDALALMTAFYTNLWAKKMPKLEALRDAQLRLLRGELDRGTSLAARGPGAVMPSPDAKSDGKAEPKPQRVPPRAWAAWMLSGDWR